MITITKTIKINATLNATIMTKIIGAITTMTVMTMYVITIEITGTVGTGTVGAIGTRRRQVLACCSGDAPCLIEGQRLGDLSITLIGVAIDIGECLSIRVYDLEAAV